MKVQPGKEGFIARLAQGLLILLLGAIVIALGVTLVSVAPMVRLIAGGLVTPIMALAVAFLYLEIKGRPWGYAGASGLGLFGVALRLAINTQPGLEVGGGLPLWITAAYLSIASLEFGTSAWTYLRLRPS